MANSALTLHLMNHHFFIQSSQQVVTRLCKHKWPKWFCVVTVGQTWISGSHTQVFCHHMHWTSRDIAWYRQTHSREFGLNLGGHANTELIYVVYRSACWSFIFFWCKCHIQSSLGGTFRSATWDRKEKTAFSLLSTTYWQLYLKNHLAFLPRTLVREPISVF